MATWRPIFILVAISVVWISGACNCSGVDHPQDSDAGADAGTIDAGAPNTADGGATTDAGAADASVGFDDAGCPLPTGLVLDAQGAGLPASGLRLWLRADTAVAVVDGGDVCRWEDVSGQGNHFTPGTASSPIWIATGLRGRPAVSFPGPNRELFRSGVLGIPPAAGRTVAVIGLTQDTLRRFHYLEMGKTGTVGTYFALDMNTYNTTGSKEGAYVTNNAYDSDVATAAEVRTHVLSISSFDAGLSLPGVVQYSVSGALRTLTRTSGGSGNGKVEDFSGADFTTIGWAAAGFTGAMVGDILIYDRPLTVDERTAVEAYFQVRYP